MMIKIFNSFCVLILLCIVFPQFSYSQATDPETRIQELGISLRTPGPPTANFVGAVRVGKMVYLSGHGPLQANGKYMIGKVGEVFNLEQAQEAARLTGINLLEALKAEVGNLNNVKRIVKVLGMVNATPSFDNHSQVINGFSDLMVEVFGENGKHARSAIGLGSLPRNIPVEIEMIVEMKE
ncbi:RidA family protein [Membranihabitans maritimus]|uniref:RidA family protein n=1 Tax=Membranihabitans maritimus TaxID=2904244 RepID=UPI001F263EE0|nr:RidA family protein [Membranihabitans maritimus]